jgi:hypothetical protein
MFCQHNLLQPARCPAHLILWLLYIGAMALRQGKGVRHLTCNPVYGELLNSRENPRFASQGCY